MKEDRLILFAALIAGIALFITIPVLIAYARHHPERRLIAKLSVGSLFSFVLWGALIAWAASDQRDDAVISKYVARLRERNLLPLAVGGLVAIGLLGGALTLLA